VVGNVSRVVAGAVLALALGFVWLLGGFGPLQVWVLEQQRQVQNALAGAVRAIKGGQPGAVLGLLSVCFAYGFLHAAGPGHGKLVIGGYGMARRVPFGRLAGVALASSLAQAAVAVGLVYAVVALLGLGRSQAEGLAEQVMAPLGTLMVAGVGLWLVWRGVTGLRAQGVQSSGSHHHHHHAHEDHHDHAPHSHGAVCDTCGHAHGPTVEEVQHLTGWRDTLALVAGIAMRPCSGALFLLILTWQLGIASAGIVGTFAMGLGTAMVTIGVAAMAVWAREGALASLPGQGAARFLPWFEIIAGLVVAVAALSLLTAAL
jgi:ABC-type nickel/cobalt efflux system permease component RcnA